MIKKEDVKMFISLVLWMLIPSLYFAIRMHIVAVNSVDIDILGQMEWFDLIDEIFVTTLITPLYCLLKDQKPSVNGFAFGVSCGIYAAFSVIVSVYVGNISEFMHAEYARQFLVMQLAAMVLGFVGSFCIMLFVIHNQYRIVAVLTVLKFLLLGISDYILLKVYADMGAAYSDILVSGIISVIALVLSVSNGLIDGKCFTDVRKSDRVFIVSWSKIGLFAGLQIFLDNFIYAVMICRMVNAVSESGNYWIANNFIWGWLLVPVSSLVQIIQKNKIDKLTWKNTFRYVLVFCILWMATMPLWGIFINKVMGVGDSDNVLRIVTDMVLYYICYMFNACFDGWFVSYGKTIYNFINSVVVNIGYYGIMYILFRNNVFALNMSFIETLFGFGMIVHTVVSVGMYWHCSMQYLRGNVR